MPEYLTPGVFIEEIERGPRPIEGVPTSTAAFLGETERGPLRPRLVTSYNDYRRWFGGPFRDGRYMPHAAAGFFENGGKRAYIARVVGDAATVAAGDLGDFAVRAAGPGAWGKRVWVRVQESTTRDSAGKPVGFRLKLAYWDKLPEGFEVYDPFEAANKGKLPRPQLQEDYDDLSVDPLSSDYFGKRLLDPASNAAVSALATLERTDGTDSLPDMTDASGVFLDEGGADDANALDPADFVGDPAGARQEVQGLRALELDPFREVALVHAPYPSDNAADINKAVIDHCERLRFRFAAVDAAREATPADLDPRSTLADTQYAGMYAPWIVIADPLTGARRSVPPGGHVLGIYARSDAERGVFKAPANEVVRGALAVHFDVDDGRQALMNPRGVNAIRSFPGRGIRVWGARTLSSNGLWKYVSVRRLFIFLERSIYESTQWVVFEPNDERLWARVKDTVRLFLRAQWRGGALFGKTEDEAFFITCDRTTMTQDDVLNGRLVCEIGIAPVRPAEFVIFRVFQHTAESQR
jgi:phage tail sheath protein FI